MPTKKHYQLPFAQFISYLKKLCSEKKSGIVFVITDTRQSAHILLINGNIVEMNFAKEKGEAALLLFRKIEKCRFHFSAGNNQSRNKKLNPHFSNESIFQTLTQETIDKKYSVLIVDDSKLVRKLVTKTLSHHYNVVEASNGLEALSILSHNTPDLILLDLIMPDMNGYKTLHHIKKNNTLINIPVLILTSRNSLLDKIQGKISQCDAYLTKPFSEESLFAEVSTFLPL